VCVSCTRARARGGGDEGGVPPKRGGPTGRWLANLLRSTQSYTEGVPMRSVFRLVVVVFLLTSIAAGHAYGQGGATWAISGVVVDTSGASIADAEVQIIDSRTET